MVNLAAIARIHNTGGRFLHHVAFLKGGKKLTFWVSVNNTLFYPITTNRIYIMVLDIFFEGRNKLTS